PVTIGFTNGIALLIASTQIKDFLGEKTPTVPSEFLARIRMLLHYVGTTRWQTVAVAATSLAIILLWPRLTKRVPGWIVALLLSTVAVAGSPHPSQRSAASFAASRKAFLTLLCPASKQHTSCLCFRLPLPLRCSRRSRVCYQQSLPTE